MPDDRGSATQAGRAFIEEYFKGRTEEQLEADRLATRSLSEPLLAQLADLQGRWRDHDTQLERVWNRVRRLLQ